MDSRLEYPDVVPSMASSECRFHAAGNLHVMIRREVSTSQFPELIGDEGLIHCKLWWDSQESPHQSENQEV
jgi:hypothetical protein